MNVWLGAIGLWAQTTTATSGPGPGPAGGPVGAGAGNALILTLRRLYSSLTLTTPDNLPGLDWVWAICLGLVGLVVLAAGFQGPGRMIGQFVDLPGLFRVFSAGMARLRKSGRMVAIVFVATVFAWTLNQAIGFNDPEGRNDLLSLTKGRGLVGLAIETGGLAGAFPLRDLIGLGSLIPLLAASAVLAFQFSSDRWGSVTRVLSPRSSRDAGWGTFTWGGIALYTIYRTVALFYRSSDRPMSGCFGVEVLVVPVLMPLADGILLAWVLVELRNARLGDDEAAPGVDIPGTIGLLPAAAVACLLIAPARYLTTLLSLAIEYLPTMKPGSGLTRYLLWQVGWGVIDLQAAAIVAIVLAGALPWCRGTIPSLASGSARLLRAEGGRLVGLVIVSGGLAACLAGMATFLVLALPAQSWVLSAADGYAHYATLPVGLWLASALVELGERAVPKASVASPLNAVETAGVAVG